MNRAPHSLDISCSYGITGKKTIKRLGTSKLEGFIILEDGKTKIRLPMRSFVRGFLDRLHDIFAGVNTSDITKIATASVAAAGSLAARAGILLGNGTGTPAITSTDLGALVSNSGICEYKGFNFTAPYAFNATQLRTGITRLITNASSAPWNIREVGLKTHKTASGASNAGNLLVSLDGDMVEVFEAVSDKLVSFSLIISRTSENGGAVLNLLRIFYNLYLMGNANKSAFLPRVGAVTVTFASSASTGPLVVDGIAGQFWGIVVGKYASSITPGEADFEGFSDGGISPSQNPVISSDEYKFNINTTDLSYGANTVSAVALDGPQALFTISRDITNNTTVSVPLNRIGLLTKGATAAPTVLKDDQIFMMINRSATDIMLAPNQTIRVEYKFVISADA